MTERIMEQWGVELDEAGSMDLYDTEDEARAAARGCPIWKVTYARQDGDET